MSRSSRRFEILLPLKYNDGSPVPDELLAVTHEELPGEFGAVSCETQTIRGIWGHAGEIYRDDLVRVFVDVANSPKIQKRMSEVKAKLKKRFRQVDIWMISYAVRIHR
jgi:hypothetical protein